MRNRAPGDPQTHVGQPGQAPGGASGLPVSPALNLPGPPPLVGSTAGRTSVPRPPKYRVVNGGMVVMNGCRTQLRAGKELDSTQYDLAFLKRQGIRLELVVPDAPEPDLPADGTPAAQ